MLNSMKFKCKFLIPKRDEVEDIDVEQLRKNYHNLVCLRFIDHMI